ncbi:uncharacterized protein M6B38_141795 [Iris pallida]|uniref:Uncharacterized protein n=1 Tax=Iris pallida TaxID=29817 RepID=A0AAX6FC53_IRIPA|nr:uncharacterized protein M6B38_141795 [Iris pallida]
MITHLQHHLALIVLEERMEILKMVKYHQMLEQSTVPSITNWSGLKLWSLYTVRGVGSDDDDDDDLSSKHELTGDEKVMKWAKVHDNEHYKLCLVITLFLFRLGEVK